MADESSVESALLALLANAIYPTGTGNPSATGDAVQLMRGWPIPAALDAALKVNRASLSIYGQNNAEQNTSRFDDDWYALQAPVETITTTIVGRTITLGGAVAIPQNVAIIVGTAPGEQSASYAVMAGDTLTSIATALAALLTTAGAPATSAGAVITVAGGALLQARPGGYGTIVRELKRQERSFQITLWCATPAQRDQLAPFVDLTIARNRRLSFDDGTVGRLLYVATHVLDEKQTLQIYRRDLLCKVEYATVEVLPAAKILVTHANVTAS